jgi:hypothetical protein
MAHSEPFQITNADGRRFHVRLVRRNEACGQDDSLLHQQDEPIVEFFDATESDGNSLNSLGYHTGIQCQVSTFFQKAFELGSDADHLFNQNLLVWSLFEEQVEIVRQWLLNELSSHEQSYLHAPPRKPRNAPEPDAADIAPCELARDRAEAAESMSVYDDAPEPLRVPSSANQGLAQYLAELIAQLDRMESQTLGWQAEEIKIRLRLHAAKKNLLKALALAHDSALKCGTKTPGLRGVSNAV